MPYVPAKCTNCGANLSVDDAKDAAICAHCGSAFIVEKAIQNFCITNQITAGVVNVYGGQSDFVIRAGVLEKYNGAATEVMIPAGVTAIGQNAFAECYALRSVTIPEGVVSIYDAAFSDCKRLEYVNLPNTLRELSGGQFHVTHIGAFHGCSSLEEIRIPSSVQHIAPSSFACCNRLKKVILVQGVKSIGKHAFWKCESLMAIDFPIGLEIIDDQAFDGCSSLSRVHFPTTLKRIGNSAFGHCTNLTEVEMNEGLEHIGQDAFRYCSCLRCVSLPRSVRKFMWSSFDNCSQLEKLVIQDSSTVYLCNKTQVMEGCSQLRDICYPNDYPIDKYAIGFRNSPWFKNQRRWCPYCGGVLRKGIFKIKCSQCDRPMDY